jgi:hypothetical protein
MSFKDHVSIVSAGVCGIDYKPSFESSVVSVTSLALHCSRLKSRDFAKYVHWLELFISKGYGLLYVSHIHIRRTRVLSLQFDYLVPCPSQ